LLDLREALQAALHLAERHPLAVDLHQVVLAPVEVEPSALVHPRQVARPEPAVAVAAADRHAPAAGRGDLVRPARPLRNPPPPPPGPPSPRRARWPSPCRLRRC